MARRKSPAKPKRKLRGRDRGEITESAFSSVIGRAARVQYFDRSGRYSREPKLGGRANFFDNRGKRYAVITFDQRAPTRSERISLDSIGRALPKRQRREKLVTRKTWISNDLRKAGVNRIRATVVDLHVTGTLRGIKPIERVDINVPSVALGRDKVRSIMAALFREFRLRGISPYAKTYRFKDQRRFAYINRLQIRITY